VEGGGVKWTRRRWFWRQDDIGNLLALHTTAASADIGRQVFVF